MLLDVQLCNNRGYKTRADGMLYQITHDQSGRCTEYLVSPTVYSMH